MLVHLRLFQSNCFEGKKHLKNVIQKCQLESIDDSDGSLLNFIKKHKLKMPPSTSTKLHLDGKGQHGQVNK